MTVTIKAKYLPLVVIVLLLVFSIGSAHPQAGLWAGGIAFYGNILYFLGFVAWETYTEALKNNNNNNI